MRRDFHTSGTHTHMRTHTKAILLPHQIFHTIITPYRPRREISKFIPLSQLERCPYPQPDLGGWVWDPRRPRPSHYGRVAAGPGANGVRVPLPNQCVGAGPGHSVTRPTPQQACLCTRNARPPPYLSCSPRGRYGPLRTTWISTQQTAQVATA